MTFVLFGGYWAIADLTGIWTSFRRQGILEKPTAPTTLAGDQAAEPEALGKGGLRPLRSCYRPVLALLLVLLVTPLPGTAMLAWDSLLILAREFSLALDGGDLVGMALSAFQAFILALQILGISYLLYALGHMLVMALWKRLGRVRREPTRPSA